MTVLRFDTDILQGVKYFKI